MKKTKGRLVVVVVAAMCSTVVGGAIYVGHAKIFGTRGLGNATVQIDLPTRGKFAVELASAIHEGGDTAARAWLLKHGAGISAQVVLSLDNTNDASGSARTGLLNTIYSINSEDLSEEELRAWAGALRELATSVLHEGPERGDYVAKSFIMEGRDQDAAAEYARFPASPEATHFFRQNPSLRMPASGGK